MTLLICAPHSRSSETLIRSYGRGKGLSIAAQRTNVPAQKPVSPSLRRVTPQDHLGSHLGVNRGSFRRRTPVSALRTTRDGGGHCG